MCWSRFDLARWVCKACRILLPRIGHVLSRHEKVSYLRYQQKKSSIHSQRIENVCMKKISKREQDSIALWPIKTYFYQSRSNLFFCATLFRLVFSHVLTNDKTFRQNKAAAVGTKIKLTVLEDMRHGDQDKTVVRAYIRIGQAAKSGDLNVIVKEEYSTNSALIVTVTLPV